MKHTYRFPLFRAMDSDAVARYLERMASNGLQLETAGLLLWKFRREKPDFLTYAVTYFPEAPPYGGPMTPAQQELAEFCAAAGWTYVTQWKRMQIYRTDLQDPVPLETDERQKLELVQSIFRKHLAPTLLILTVLFALTLFYFRLYSLFRAAFRTFPILPLGFACVVVLFLIVALELLIWWIWLRKARRQIALGGVCPPSLFPVSRSLSAVVLLSMSVLLFLTTAATISNQQPSRGVRLPMTPILAAMSYFFVWLARKRGWDRKKFLKIYTIYAAIAIFLSFLWIFVINGSHTR